MKEKKKHSNIRKMIIDSHIITLIRILEQPQLIETSLLLKLYKLSRKELYKRGVFK